MGFLDDIVSQQSGGGLLGGLPASWQYTNPDSLSPVEKQMMAMVGTQNPDKAGFAPLPASTGAFPVNGTAPITGLGGDNGQAAPTIGAPPPANLSAFNTGASPAIFVNPPGSTPGNPMMPPPANSPVAAADDSEDAPAAPAANAPAAPISVGDYQMPRVGPSAAFAPNPAALPVNAQATQGLGGPGQAAATNVGDNLMTGYQNLRHGGGIIGSIVAAVTGRRNDPYGVAQQQQAQVANVTARALINKGVPQDVAMAAVQPGNAEFLKTLVTQAFGPKTVQSIGEGWIADKDGNIRRAYTPEQKDNFSLEKRKDALGNETLVKINKSTGDVTDVNGAGGAAGPAFGSLLAPGVTYDPNKSGEEYLAQFGPEVQSAAKAYMRGDVMPTGNARNQSIATFAKTVAQKYGQDMGIPVNDSTYAGKRNMAIQLTGSSNSSMGGILSNGESSFSHLAEATKSMVDMDNASHDFMFGGAIAHGQNYLKNHVMGGSDKDAKVGALVDNLGKYGAESTKFYAGTGGGVEERTAARKDVDPNKVSGEEMAAFAKKEKSLMLDRLNTKFQEIRNTYGEEEGNAIIAKHMPQIQKNIATIDANITKLSGEAPADDAVAVPTLKVGETAKVGSVSIKKVSDK